MARIVAVAPTPVETLEPLELEVTTPAAVTPVATPVMTII
jgi:hypothetical protein